MAIKSDPPQEDTTPQTGINLPDLTDSGKIQVKAITSAAQAWTIVENLKFANRDRNITDAMIYSKYGGSPPYDQQSLANASQAERYNFPTGFMSSIVDRVTPVPIQLIESARYLTASSLKCSDDNPNAAEKTERLREAVTRTIRRWPEWKTFVTELSQELILIGRAFVIFKDPYTPWPKFFRCDQAFLPEGTGQHATNVQFIAADEDVMVHELVNLIKDKQSAKDAGWNIENCIEAVNKALPKKPTESTTTGSAHRTFEDAIREGNPGASYAGATIIEVSHVWAVEPSDTVGQECKVSHYIVNRRGDHEELFYKYERYDDIQDAVSLFTLEAGNGKFYGSRGLGRKLINMHLAIDRARNRMMDQLEVSGLSILKTDASRAPYVQFKVRHPFVLVTSDAEFVEQGIQANASAFLEIDTKISDIAQQAVGQYIPNMPSSENAGRDKTAREVTIDAQREAEQKVAFLSRFWGQFGDLVSALQRKILDPDTNDKACQKMQADLMEGYGEGDVYVINQDDINEFRESPSAEVVQDLTQIQNAQIQAVAAKYLGNPGVDSQKLMLKDITSMSSPSLADEIVLKDQNQQTNTVEAVRQQMIETEAIMTGAEGIPVSPRDIHDVHLQTMFPDLNKALDQAMTAGIGADPASLGKYANGMYHAEAHIQALESQKANPDMLKSMQNALQQLDDKLKQLSIKVAQGRAQQAQAAQQQASQAQAAQAQQQQAQKEAISINYKDAPPSIQRQMEAAAGFTPANPAEAQVQQAQEAVLKHPDLPQKVAQHVQASQPPPAQPPTDQSTLPQ